MKYQDVSTYEIDGENFVIGISYDNKKEKPSLCMDYENSNGCDLFNFRYHVHKNGNRVLSFDSKNPIQVWEIKDDHSRISNVTHDESSYATPKWIVYIGKINDETVLWSGSTGVYALDKNGNHITFIDNQFLRGCE